MATVNAADRRAGVEHPLDPLSADEIRRVVAVLRRDRGVGPGWRFGWIELCEPSKRAVREFVSGAAMQREAWATCWSRDEGQTYRARVSIGGERVLSWEP